MKKELIKHILDCIKKLNKSGAEPNSVADETTVLLGFESGFGSLELANLLISIEDRVLECYKVQIDLVNESVLSQTDSPFKNVESLASFIQKEIEK